MGTPVRHSGAGRACLEQTLVAVHDLVVQPLQATQRAHVRPPDVDAALHVRDEDLQRGCRAREDEGISRRWGIASGKCESFVLRLL